MTIWQQLWQFQRWAYCQLQLRWSILKGAEQLDQQYLSEMLYEERTSVQDEDKFNAAEVDNDPHMSLTDILSSQGYIVQFIAK